MEASLSSIQSGGQTATHEPQKSHLSSTILIIIYNESWIVNIKSVPIVILAKIKNNYTKNKKYRKNCHYKKIHYNLSI